MARKRKDPELEDGAPDGTAAAGRSGVLRFALWTLSVVILVLGSGYTALRIDEFLSTDARFRLPVDETSGLAAVTLNGLKNASRSVVLHAFDEDRGRSVYRIDLQIRRERVERVEWVRSATVRRIWPNRLAVDVVERKPVAMIQVPAGTTGSQENPLSYRAALIDAEGVILHSHTQEAARLPLVRGVREEESATHRREQVRRALRLLDELQRDRDSILEVDVAQPDDLRILYQIEGIQVTLLLGEERFRERLEVFKGHFPKVKDKLPPHPVMDVSLDGRITATQ